LDVEPGAERVSPAPEAPARIGPNAVIQTLRALRELEGDVVERLVALTADLPDPLPPGMIPEAWFVRLLCAVRNALPGPRAEAVLRRAGRYTADYVRRHRIPRAVRLLLRLLPARLAVPLLLHAFRRHAWTFAGAGHYTFKGPYPGTIMLEGCPTCRAECAARVHGHAGGYYEAAFEGLLSLAASSVSVREVACQAQRAACCRYRIFIGEVAAERIPCESY
jgi:divinyl protochlorophyllide a 8-vinyl-reductase